MICSMTSSGLEMPPDQKASQMRSIWFLISPVIISDSAKVYHVQATKFPGVSSRLRVLVVLFP